MRAGRRHQENSGKELKPENCHWLAKGTRGGKNKQVRREITYRVDLQTEALSEILSLPGNNMAGVEKT